MRKSGITETMIRQSKEIWERLKPGEFTPEPGDWILCGKSFPLGPPGLTLINHSGESTWAVNEIPIFTFSHCLDLLKGRGLEFYQVRRREDGRFFCFFYMGARYGNHGVNNIGELSIHEAAQAVLLKVLKGGS